jgi:hypothetical protein
MPRDAPVMNSVLFFRLISIPNACAVWDSYQNAL